MHLSEAITEYRHASHRVSPDTWRWYAQKLDAFVDYCLRHDATEVSHLTPRLVRRFEASLRETTNRRGQPLSTYTLHGYIQVIKGFMNWLAREEELPDTITKRIAMPTVEQKVIQTFSAQQIRALFDACRYEPFPTLVHRDKALLAVLLDTGLRASEVCGLTLDRLHLTSQDAYLTVMGKGRKQREVGLASRDGRRYLHAYVTHYRKAAGKEAHVFTNRWGDALTVDGLDKVVKRLREWANPRLFEGIRVSAHTFRHTFAVNYLQAGGDIYALSRLLGHTSVTVTEVYLKDYRAKSARAAGISVLDAMCQR